MDIESIKIEELKPYKNNPRYNDEAVEGVKESIKQFGFKVPLVIDKNNVIVCGHTRYKASVALGLSELPCIRASELTDEQVWAFRIADNKSGHFVIHHIGRFRIRPFQRMERLLLQFSDLAN